MHFKGLYQICTLCEKYPFFRDQGNVHIRIICLLFWKRERVSSVPEFMLDFYKGIKLIHWLHCYNWNCCLNRLLFHVSKWNRSRTMLFYHQSEKELRSLVASSYFNKRNLMRVLEENVWKRKYIGHWKANMLLCLNFMKYFMCMSKKPN